MHIIKPYETAVTLFHVDGGVWTYPSLCAAAKDLGLNWINRNVGEHFVQYTHKEYSYQEDGKRKAQPVYRTHAYIMRNDFGQAVTWLDFGHLVRKTLPWYQRRYLDWNGKGPVPGTGKPKAGHDYYQKGSPSRLRRTAVTAKDEGEVRPRPKQDLGSHYDDAWDWYSYNRCKRSWKHYRKHQWRD